MPEKPLRTITVDELLPEELALTADPEKFKQYLKNKGLQLPPPPAGGDAGKRLIMDHGKFLGIPVFAEETSPPPRKSPKSGPLGLQYDVESVPSDQMPTGLMGPGSPRTMPKSGGKFAEGFLPGAVSMAPAGPLGMAVGGTAGGLLNMKYGPDPTSARASAETLASTATSALPVGRMNSAIAALPGSQEWLKKLAMFGANAVVGGASTAAANEAGNQAARMSGEMRGAPANINVPEAIGGAALANGALGVLGGAGRMIAKRLPPSVTNAVNPVLERLKQSMGTSSAPRASAPRPQPPQQGPFPMGPVTPPSAPPPSPDVLAERLAQQRAAKEASIAAGRQREQQFMASQAARGAPVPPESLASTPPPAASTPVTKAAPAPPPKSPMETPVAPVMGGAVPEPESDMERLLAESIKARQAGKQVQAMPPAEVQPDPNLARGVTGMAQNDLVKALRNAGMPEEEISKYAKALESDPDFRRKISRDGIPMPGSSSKPEGVLGTGNPEAGAAPLGEPLVNAVNATKGAAEEVGNAWRDWGRNRNAPPVVEDRALADRMYLDYARSRGISKVGEARNELDKMIDGDPTQFIRAIDEGGPEFRDAARTRTTEKILEAFRLNTGDEKTGEVLAGFVPGSDKLSILDKFHEMRRSEVGGGTTGGQVLRKVFGTDAVDNIEKLYEALEKSRNLPSQQPKTSGGNAHLSLIWNNRGPLLRVFAPAGMLGAGAMASLPAAAVATTAGGLLGAAFEFGPAKIGQMLASRNSRKMNFLLDAVENGGKFTNAQVAQFISGLASQADQVSRVQDPQEEGQQ